MKTSLRERERRGYCDFSWIFPLQRAELFFRFSPSNVLFLPFLLLQRAEPRPPFNFCLLSGSFFGSFVASSPTAQSEKVKQLNLPHSQWMAEQRPLDCGERQRKPWNRMATHSPPSFQTRHRQSQPEQFFGFISLKQMKFLCCCSCCSFVRQVPKNL